MPDTSADQGHITSSYPNRTRVAWADAAVLSTLVALSIGPYLWQLGFYNDDWFLLAELNAQRAGSIEELYAALARFDWVAVRPVLIMFSSLSFRAFGLDAHGYHLLHACLSILMVVALHRALVELGVSRLVAFAVPLVFAMVPSYSTVRFWFAAFGYTLSVLAYVVSLYSDLRAVRDPNRLHWGWKAAGSLALIVSCLGFEVMFPFLVLHLFLLPALVRRRHGTRLPRSLKKGLGIGLAVNAAALVAIAIAKMAPGGTGALSFDAVSYRATRLVLHMGLELGSFGAGLPQAATWGLRRASALQIVAVMAIAAATFLHCRRIIGAGQLEDRRTWASCAIAGGGLYVLGYVMFLVTGRFTYTVTGIGNRTGIASALGLAVLCVGAAGVAVSFISSLRVRTIAMCALVAGTVAGGSAALFGASTYWADAWTTQQHTLSAVRSELPVIPRATTIILDGVCPYEGPVTVFDSDWDFAGMLATSYGDTTLKGNVLTRRMRVANGRLVTTVYGAELTYAPGSHLLLFRFRAASPSSVVRLDDVAALRWAIATSPTRETCARGIEGHGIPVLPLERWASERFGGIGS